MAAGVKDTLWSFEEIAEKIEATAIAQQARAVQDAGSRAIGHRLTSPNEARPSR